MKIRIENKEYEIKKEFAQKNCDMITIQADQLIGINPNWKIKKETEKAICIQDKQFSYWIPKSVLENDEFIPTKVHIIMYQDVINGFKTIEEFKNQFSQTFLKYNENIIFEKLNSSI